MHRIRLLLIVAGGIAADGACTHAQGVASSNLDIGGGFAASSPLAVRGPGAANPSPDWTASVRFKSCAPEAGITEVILPLRHTGGTNAFRVEVRRQQNNLPGALLGQFTSVQGAATAQLVSIPGDGSITLEPGEPYWLVLHALGDAEGEWHRADGVEGFVAWSRDQGANWHFAGGPPPALRIIVDQPNPWPPCPTHCDDRHLICWRSSTVISHWDEFICFINEFAIGQSLPHEQQISHYANCDGSTVAPVLNIDDFTCFVNALAIGCP